LSVIAAHVAPLRADDTTNMAPVTKFVVRATPEPVPALKYRLLPSFLDLKPGNAAIVYTKIAVEFQGPLSDQAREIIEKIADWQEVPAEKLPRAEVEAALAMHAERIKEAGRAARMETCDWQLPVRGDKPWTIMLPEVQGIRSVARVVILRSRLAIADGRFDDALYDLQTTFAMARHVSQGPTLVNGLVGIAISGIGFREVEGLMRAPNAPNLYWAIMGLPRPWIDLRPAMDAETHFIDFSFPKLQDVDSARYSADQWREQLVGVAANMASLLEIAPPASAVAPEYIAAGFAIKTYPRGKKLLIAAGIPVADVEKMPVAEVALRGMMQDYRRVRDENFKWSYVPYAQRGDGPKRAAKEIENATAHVEGYPFVSLLSAVSAVSLAQVRSERLVAIHAAVEALRIHAAAHGGQLPARLSDVTLAPVLDDPLTGKQFGYTVTGRTAAITSPAPAGLDPAHFALEYELTIQP
jgi:hypothetical protein